MDVIFMGTPDFAVPVLQALFDSGRHTVKAVVTQPDKARGRSGKPVFTPVKKLAVEKDVPVYTPERVKDSEFVQVLREISCDVIVVAAFGQILSKEILEMPKFGCINVHASLLPRWRGAAPIQWSILAGDEKTGITTMQMDVGLDTGDILLKKEITIDPEETGESLFDRLAELGGPLLLETLEQAEKGMLEPVPQEDEKSTYAKILTKETGKLDFSWEANKLERYVRGLNSWPSAYTYFRGKLLKIWRAQVVSRNTEFDCGTVAEVSKESFSIQTGDGLLELCEVQLEGKKRMSAGDFLRGMKIVTGEKL
ncbi:MAG: methionyl-tRNA formyltransferase [Roseburia sp.]|nr:methionyl-tRNA formyltransferase [Roseburia sp.]